MLKLGAHMSIAGGVDLAIPRGQSVGCEVIQIFTKSSNQWAARALADDEVQRFRAAQKDGAPKVVAGHTSYLINLGSPDETLHRRSLDAFVVEMQRAERLGLRHLIFHPGAHTGSGEEAGLLRIAQALDEAQARTPGFKLVVLLENAAGQGSTLGGKFEHLAEILSRVSDSKRLGVCLDTCHAHAAGYDLRTHEGYEAVMESLDRTVGLPRVRAFHLNDCLKGVGSKLDRHWHIGKGMLGLEPFRLLMNDSRFDGLPGFLETPKDEECAEDRINLAVLRSLVGDPARKAVPTQIQEVL